MTIIRQAQMEAFERDIEARRKREYAGRLRHDHPARTAALNDGQLAELVGQGVADAQELEITGHENVYRFLTLQFLPAETLNSPLNQSVLIRVLNNLTWSGTKRLDFIQQHIVHRKMNA